jgi:hypothetical protein
VLSERQAWPDGTAVLVPVVRISQSRLTIAASGAAG